MGADSTALFAEALEILTEGPGPLEEGRPPRPRARIIPRWVQELSDAARAGHLRVGQVVAVVDDEGYTHRGRLKMTPSGGLMWIPDPELDEGYRRRMDEKARKMGLG